MNELDRTDRILLRTLNVAALLFAFVAPATGALYAAAGNWTPLLMAIPGVLACAFITWVVPDAIHRIHNEQHDAERQREHGDHDPAPVIEP